MTVGNYVWFTPIHFLIHRVANFTAETVDWSYIPSNRLSPHVPMGTILLLEELNYFVILIFY